jgi:formate dehydrogenase major subunit
MHRLLALRQGLRGSAGHLCADHRRPGFDSRVSFGAKTDNALASDCVSCGACVQACPTATLQEKSIIEIGTPSHSVITTCAYCGVGCQFKAEMRGDELVRMTPYKHGKANRGHSCVKGGSPMAMPATRTAS